MGNTTSSTSIQNPISTLRANVVTLTADPTKNGLVICNADGSLIGSTLPFLKLDQTTPQTIANGLPIFSSLTAGSVLFAGTGGALSQDNANLFWDDTNNRLGIGIAVPLAPLHISVTTGATGLKLFQIDASEGGGFSITDTATSGFLPTFNFTSFGLNGYGGAFIGAIPVATDVLNADGGAIVVDARRSDNTVIVNSHLFNVRNLGTTKFVVNSSGFVGIGTNAPTGLLNIQSSAGSNPNFVIGDADTTNPFTSVFSDAKACGRVTSVSSSAGGLTHDGYSGTGSTYALLFRGFVGSTTPTVSAVEFRAGKLNGTTYQNIGATEQAFSFGNIAADVRYATILGSGNIGIGLTAPTSKLHQDSGTGVASYTQYTANATTGQAVSDGTLFGINALGETIINQQENLPLRIYTNNTERVTVLGDGKVGINGTPSYLLDIQKTIVSGSGEFLLRLYQKQTINGYSNQLLIRNDDTSIYSTSAISFQNSSGVATVTMGAANATYNNPAYPALSAGGSYLYTTGNFGLVSDNDAGRFAFQVGRNTAGIRQVITTVGVGIGIITPTSKLHQDSGNATATYHQFTAGTTTGQLVTDGSRIGIDESGNLEIRQQENLPLWFYTNSTKQESILATGDHENIRGKYHYHRQTLGSDTDGDWRTYSDASGFYTDYRTGGAWVNKQTIYI